MPLTSDEDLYALLAETRTIALIGASDRPDRPSYGVMAYLQSRAEGNPLFLGELLRALEEAGTLHPDEHGWRLGDLTATAVPALLRQVIDGRAANHP